jgi:hypothetical protein
VLKYVLFVANQNSEVKCVAAFKRQTKKRFLFEYE